jgi:acetoin utilization deacetylase AcuC-like enzyme
MGFCLLNNIALAVEYLVQNFGARRLAIIDLDLHHGNGTQDIFWQRKDVFYISTHQSPLYPHSGFLHETGGGDAKGTNANFPFPPGSGDQAFRVVMNELILPLLNNFAPQMLLVSYGFDTHWSDPLGSLLLSAAGYAELIQSLADWADEHCQGRIAIFLEGGYNLEAAAACTQGVTAALLGYLAPNRVESVGATPAGRQIAWEDPLGPYPGRESQAWQGMVEKARQIWSDRLSFN